MLVLAFLTASFLLPRELKRRGLHPEASDWIIMLAVIGAIVGSKIGYVFEVWGQIWFVDKGWGDTLYHILFYWKGMGIKYPGRAVGLWESLLTGSGLVFYGGFVASFSFVYIFLRKMKYEVWRYGDSIMPSLAIGYALGRLGCLVSGDGCYGHAASVRIPLLTMVYEPLSFLTTHGLRGWNQPAAPSHGVNVWNTPMIEALASSALFLFLMLWARHRKFRPGMLTAVFLIYNGIARFLVEFIRLNDAIFPILEHPAVSVFRRYTKEGLLNWHWYGINQPQIFALFLIIVGIIWIIRRRLYLQDDPGA